MGRILSKFAPVAITLITEGIHLCVTQIRGGDHDTIRSVRELAAVKESWSKELIRTEKMTSPTPGELQDIKLKENLIKKMEKAPKHIKVATGSGYSIVVKANHEVSNEKLQKHGLANKRPQFAKKE